MLKYENNVAPPTKTGTHVVLDYFRASFEFDNLDAEDEEIVVREMVYEIGTFLGIPKEEISERNFKKDKYKYMFDLGVEMELGMIGPKAASGLPTCSLHLKGQGCREFEARCPNKTWGDFLNFLLLDYEAKPSRIDIAIDDYDGDVVTMEWLKDKLERKQFTSTFKHKYHKIHGCVEEGFSLEMGSRYSSCQLMIYDKLKEQTVKKKKQVNQDYWVRYEMRFFHEKACKVALEMLLAMEGKLIGVTTKSGIQGFLDYVNSVFLGILDVKEDNGQDADHQCDIETDPLWKRFVHDAEKWKVVPEVNRNNTWESKQNSVKRVLPNYLMVQYLKALKNPYHFTTLVLKDFLEYYSKLYKKPQQVILNKYLIENGMAPLDDLNLHLIEDELKSELEERELPF